MKFLLILTLFLRCEAFLVCKRKSCTSNGVRYVPEMQKKAQDPELKGVPGLKGYYVRPSRAIEKGGGFFVPGLEGGRIRVASATILLAFFAINSNGIQRIDWTFVVSTLTGVLASIVLLLQGVNSILPSTQKNNNADIDVDKTAFFTTKQINTNIVGNRSVIKSVSSAIIQSITGIRQVLVLSSSNKNNNSNSSNDKIDQIGYELAPVLKASSQLKQELSNESLDGIQDQLIIIPPSKFTLYFNSIEKVLWIVGSEDSAEQLAKELKYLTALFNAPLQ